MTDTEFEDADLAPERTTRNTYDPLGQALEVLWKAPNLAYGDELLVDTSDYGVPGVHWCEVTHLVPGSAAVYPYKVQVPGRGTGQYRAREVLGWRRPLALHELVCERFGVTHGELTGARRSQNIVYPRQVAMYLARELLRVSRETANRVRRKRVRRES